MKRVDYTWVWRKQATRVPVSALLLVANVTGSVECSEQRNLTPAQLAFGEQQLSKMLADRPTMRELVSENDLVSTWVAKQFAGESTRWRFHWSSTVPTTAPVSRFAFHHYDPESKSGWIFVGTKLRSGKAPDAEFMWASLIFELLNTQNDERFDRAWEKVLSGKSTKAEFVREYSLIEYGTLKRLHSFYKKCWAPCAQAHGRESHASYWGADIPDSYESWASAHRKSDPAYFDYYESIYDDAIKTIRESDEERVIEDEINRQMQKLDQNEQDGQSIAPSSVLRS